MGRYTLSTQTEATGCGRYAASLSIRSGHGMATHDRVYRFTPLFPSSQAAERYAFDQGLGYLPRPA